jgi:hypothetical protein
MRLVSLCALIGAALAVGCGDVRGLDPAGGAPGGAGGIGGSVAVAGQDAAGAGVPGGIIVPPLPGETRYGYFYGNFVRSGKVYGVPAGGGAPVVIASSPAGRNLGRTVVFDDANVYSSDEPDYSGVPPEGMTSIVALPIQGGAARTLASGLYLVMDLAVDAQNVYFIDEASGVGAVSKSGGEVRHLHALAGGGFARLAVAGGFLYWTDGDLVWRMPVAGGAAEMLASGEVNAGPIAADASGVYWLDVGPPSSSIDCMPPNGSLHFVAAGATAPTTLAQQLSGVESMAVGGGSVYFSGVGAGCNGFVDGTGWIGAMAPGDHGARMVQSAVTIPSNLYVGGGTLYFTTVTDLDTNALGPHALPL